MPTKYIPQDGYKPDKAKNYSGDDFYRNLGPWTKIGEGLYAGPRQKMGIKIGRASA